MERPILYINACVRKESRTRKLAEELLMKLNEPFEEIYLNQCGQLKPHGIKPIGNMTKKLL